MSRRSLCAIHQPNFFPRLSTLAKLYAADTWVILDDVQFASRDYQHRARLGRLDDPNHQQWLSLSVQRPDGRASKLDQVRIVDQQICRRRTALLLQQYYGRSPHWPTFQEALQPVLDCMTQANRLTDVTEASTLLLLRLVGWSGVVLHSGELQARTGRSERLVDLTMAAGGTEYLCGTGGRRYLDTQPFVECGLSVRWFEAPAARDGSADIWALARRVSMLRAFMMVGQDLLRSELIELRARYL